MPASETKKALDYGRDGHALLKADAAARSDPDLALLARLHQAEVLRAVLVQNYLAVEDEQGREVIRRREADPASPRRMASMPDGGQARHVLERLQGARHRDLRHQRQR
jgi:hypothetical protein